MEKTIETQILELADKKVEIEGEISLLSSSANSHKLTVETLEKEINGLNARIAELQKVKQDAEKSASDSVATLKSVRDKVATEIAALNKSVTDKESEKKTLEGEIAELNAAITVATQAQLTVEGSLAKAQADHAAFTKHADSEKTRIMGELKELDDAAKAQVVVIESQTAVQTTLDEQISTKREVVAELDTDIESKTKRAATVTTELQTLETKHANRMKVTGEEFKTFMDETEAAKKKASESLALVEASLKENEAKAVAQATRHDELEQRENFLKERYQRAGIAW